MAGVPESGGVPLAASGQGKEGGARWMDRAVVDTSAPFVSVREAVDHFGGSAHWRDPVRHFSPHSHFQDGHCTDVVLGNMEEQARQLEKDLVVKERETLEVLKELEMTKRILDGLKLKVQVESSEASVLSDQKVDGTKIHPVTDTEEYGSQNPNNLDQATGTKPSPGLILMELKQAKLNLNRTTSGLADIRANVKEFKDELEKEKFLMEKTREKIAFNTTRISSMEKDLSQRRWILQLVKDSEFKKVPARPPHISRKFHELRSEAEQFKKVKAASESEILKMIEEIERNKSGIKILELREGAARKLEEAANSMRMVTLAKVKASTNSQNPVLVTQYSSGVTMTVKEYNMLVQKAQEAEGISTKKIEAALARVEEANKSKMVLSKRVEEADMEIKNSRKFLNEALHRVEAANSRKLAVEEALRKWRSDHGQKRRSIHNSPRFKNPCPSHPKRNSKTPDPDGLSSSTDIPTKVLTPSLSIGQILSRKLLGPEEMESGYSDPTSERPKLSANISLGQMLNRRYWSSPESNGDKAAAPRKSFHPKRKKLGFVGNFSLTLVNRKRKNKKKKKRRQAWSPK